MADFLDDLSEADIDAVLNRDVDSISEAGLDVLSSLTDEQFAQLAGNPSTPTAPQPTGEENSAAAFGGMFDDTFGEGTGAAIAENPIAQGIGAAAAGASRAFDSTKRGLQQLAASPEEALALGEIEKVERERFKEFDEGLGMEDVGEAMAFLGTLLIPGGNGIKVAQAGSKVLNAIKAVPGTLGGTSLFAGLIEGSKAVTPDESRAKNVATAAAVTAIGGKGFQIGGGLIKNSFKEGVMGKVAGALGLATLSANNAARQRTSGGLASLWSRKLFGRAPKDEAGLAAGRVQAGAERQGQTLNRKATEARAAEASKDGLAAGDPVWDSWFDLVRGPRGKTLASGKPGRRRKASGLEGTRPSKTQDVSGLDVATERNRIVGTLMTAAQRKADDGTVTFDVTAAREAWNKLKKNARFKKVYMTKLKSGGEKLGTKGQAVEDFLDDLLTKGVPTGQGVSVPASTVLKQGAEDIVQGGARAAERIRQAAKPAAGQAPKATKATINARAAALSLQQLQSQDLLADAEKNIVTDGWFGFMDYFDTLEDQARAIADEE
jgi:hypothetical protein